MISIGCGPAVIEDKLYQMRKDIQFVTLDKNKEMLTFIPLYLHPIWADATLLPLATKIVDIIVCITSLEFMNHPKQALYEIHRVLKPKGIFLGLLLNPYSHYIEQKRNDRKSYIGMHLQQKTYQLISSTIDKFFNQYESYLDLYVENNKIKKESSINNARLLIMKAIK